MAKIFKDKGGDVYYVELEADVDERLRRNKTEHRLLHKPTKRNLDFSENDIKKSMLKHRMNSEKGEVKEKNYLRIDNTYLEADDVALKIKSEFKL